MYYIYREIFDKTDKKLIFNFYNIIYYNIICIICIGRYLTKQTKN